MDKEDIEKCTIAGKIAAQIRDYGASLIKKNSSMVEVLDKIEEKIDDLYKINCDKCKQEFVGEAFIWEKDKPKEIRFSKFFVPIAVRAGVFQVTANGVKPYSKHFTTCHVLSFPPLTGITQS